MTVSVTSYTPGSRYVCSGDGTFEVGASYQVGGNPLPVEIEDMNGDGYQDLVVMGRASDDISVLLGRGDGTFEERTTAVAPRLAGSSYGGVRVGDFNNDGALDVVSTNYFDPSTDQLQIFIGTPESVATMRYLDLFSQESAQNELVYLEEVRQRVLAERSQQGSNESKVETLMNYLLIASENFKAAESKIKDADIAAEAASLTRLQILQQANTAVLAQINLQPELALSLLA